MTAQTLNLSSLVSKIDGDRLELLCRDNPDARLETNPQGQLVIMSPTGSETGDRNLELAFQIKLWNKKTKKGKVFDSSTGFRLSNGAVRSPDVSWVKIETWNSLNKEQKRTSVTSFGGHLQRRGLKFAPIDPDFVIELMSPICEAVSFRTDSLEELQKKMQEYINCGVKLGWLINPDERQVEIYRYGQSKQVMNNPALLEGENILPELAIDLSEIFD